MILNTPAPRFQQIAQTIHYASQPAWAGKPGLTEQTSLLHSTVDLLHFISNHLFIMPVIKIVIQGDTPSAIAFVHEPL